MNVGTAVLPMALSNAERQALSSGGHPLCAPSVCIRTWLMPHMLCVHDEPMLTLHICGMQLFPYHLADYACRVLRVTPFRYYVDLLFTVMREEKSYDQIPNFTVSLQSSNPFQYRTPGTPEAVTSNKAHIPPSQTAPIQVSCL